MDGLPRRRSYKASSERTNVRGVGTREEALGTSAWEASER